MQHVYKNIDEYNIGKKNKTLIVIDGIIADTIHDNKLNPVVA